MTRLGFPFQGTHQRREAEWVGAMVLFGVACALLAPGPTFSRPTFDPFAAIAPEGTWGAALMGIAVVRMVGLWVNGSKRHSPLLRFVTATVGAVMWGPIPCSPCRACPSTPPTVTSGSRSFAPRRT